MVFGERESHCEKPVPRNTTLHTAIRQVIRERTSPVMQGDSVKDLQKLLGIEAVLSP